MTIYPVPAFVLTYSVKTAGEYPTWNETEHSTYRAGACEHSVGAGRALDLTNGVRRRLGSFF